MRFSSVAAILTASALLHTSLSAAMVPVAATWSALITIEIILV